MKKFRILILIIVPVFVLIGCERDVPQPTLNAKFNVTDPITDQLTGFQGAASMLLNDAVAFNESADPIARTIGDYMTKAGNAMDTASYYLNIAKEATVSVSGNVSTYSYSIFTWTPAGGEQSTAVEYKVTAGTDNSVHEVTTGGTKIIEATVANADLESGTMSLSFSGNLGSPDYTFEWTQVDANTTDIKVDDKAASTPTYVEILQNADETKTFNAKESSALVFSADANAEGLKGSYKKYDASGNVTDSGTWDLLAEDLNIVTLSFIQLYTPITAMRDSLGAQGATYEGAQKAYEHFGGSMVNTLAKYVYYYTPPPDATTSQDPIEGDRWSLVYYWGDLAYQKSATPATYYHTVYMKNGEAWDTICHAEDSKTSRNAEMFFVKDTMTVWDFTSHFTLKLAQDGVSDHIHLVSPFGPDPAWQDYYLTFKPETLEASDWKQVFNNSFGDFNWRVGNWTANAATGYWEEWGWGPHEVKNTYTWPSRK